MTDANVKILEAISRKPVTRQEIEKLAGVSMPTLKVFSAAAGQCGLVEIKKIPKQRIYYYVLTKRGARVLELAQKMKDLEREVEQELKGGEKETFSEAEKLQKLIKG